MKILISYFTMTRRTQKVAENIEKFLKGHDVIFWPFEIYAKKKREIINMLKRVESGDFTGFENRLKSMDAQNFDLVIFGSPNYLNRPPKTMKQAIKQCQHLASKKVILYVTAMFSGKGVISTMRKLVEEKGGFVISSKYYKRVFGIRRKDGLKIAEIIQNLK